MTSIPIGIPGPDQDPFRLTIAPNPTSGVLLLNVENASGPLTIDVYNVQGRLVLSRQTAGNGSSRLETGLEPGVYFMSVKNKAQKNLTTKKFIVE